MSLKAFHYQKLLLSNAINSATLESQLAAADNLASFRILLSNRSIVISITENVTALNIILGSAIAKAAFLETSIAFEFIADSPKAIKNICTSKDILVKVFDNNDRSIYQLIKNNPVGYAALKRQVNASGSKLKKYIFLASGTLTPPSNIVLDCRLAIGAGGNATVTTGGGYKGGGGGEMVVSNNTSSFPTTNQTVTVAAGTNASIGSLITAVKGATGNSGGAGGGTTTGDNIALLQELYTLDDLSNDVWFFGNFNLAGGSGGAFSSTMPAAGTAGGFPYSFGGQAGGGGFGGLAGVGIGAGGGGGLNVSSLQADGGSAAANSWGSGGGQANYNGSGGSGNIGLAIYTCIAD